MTSAIIIAQRNTSPIYNAYGSQERWKKLILEQNEVRIVVAGSRKFHDYEMLCSYLDDFIAHLRDKFGKDAKVIVISGRANGADKLGEKYAKERGYECELYPADWDNLGKGAGVIRNGEMAGVADAVIVFRVSFSNGSSDMISRAKKKNLELKVVEVLECSSKGDTDYSPFFAKVKVFGKWKSIEDAYQQAKRFGTEKPPKSWRDAKGKKPTHIEINGIQLDVKYLNLWYKLLWVKYLDSKPLLVKYAKQFDEFTDLFGKSASITQAQVVRQYVKEGRESIINECRELMDILRKGVV